jgi:hypothetical protein
MVSSACLSTTRRSVLLDSLTTRREGYVGAKAH